ncbi:DinB family protein [Nocardiopsis ganjiahuensis]|uniref:DinB family protein n=1 Tax=Nocardiopsis ganjiahuensis TaxID=239984 RepID=UPI000348C34D|nr:DinB family protein [Nocardiopsis ganjiahuensis]
MTATVTETNHRVDAERDALLSFLAEQREFLLTTVRGLDDARLQERPTASVLNLIGIVKHVSGAERGWLRFIEEGPDSKEVDYESQETYDHHENTFRLVGDETVEGVLSGYAETAEATEACIRALPDLEVSQKLPPAPWFPEETAWTARDVLLHLIRETAQHCGHADIIRESIDGQKTMG